VAAWRSAGRPGRGSGAARVKTTTASSARHRGRRRRRPVSCSALVRALRSAWLQVEANDGGHGVDDVDAAIHRAGTRRG
jgi:hypothetical protein